MRLTNRNLLILAAVLIGGWLLLRGTGHVSRLPWNVGQAGSIFQSGHGGGGQ